MEVAKVILPAKMVLAAMSQADPGALIGEKLRSEEVRLPLLKESYRGGSFG